LDLLLELEPRIHGNITTTLAHPANPLFRNHKTDMSVLHATKHFPGRAA
jgi:hypothetical protein